MDFFKNMFSIESSAEFMYCLNCRKGKAKIYSRGGILFFLPGSKCE